MKIIMCDASFATSEALQTYKKAVANYERFTLISRLGAGASVCLSGVCASFHVPDAAGVLPTRIFEVRAGSWALWMDVAWP
eukprot:9290-Heterococcus_DN1.PRE.3